MACRRHRRRRSDRRRNRGNRRLLTRTATTAFGRIQAGGGTGINFYKGNLDEIAIYDVAMPASTVLDHYTVATLP